MRLSESSDALTVGYATWLGVLVLVLGVALAGYVVRHFNANGRTFGYVAAVLVCLFGALHFLGYKAQLTREGARVYEPLRRVAQVSWAQVSGFRIEERPARRGKEMALVFEGGSDAVYIGGSALTVVLIILLIVIVL